MVEKQLTRERASSWSWILQAFTGIMLVVLLGLHMVVQHFVVTGGLRNYQQVVQYISNPFLFLLEIAFLIMVTWHALLGVRAIILDLGLNPATERKVTAFLSIVGVVVVAYGIWLSATIVAQGA
ncbi:MAG TPA: succinate dehydrogenase, cytochrome b556 subunit [Anaerolineae bacterium]|nr:succinate dehydrogenase, cytochrome b556 subunit [Anaerolineae bacterium]